MTKILIQLCPKRTDRIQIRPNTSKKDQKLKDTKTKKTKNEKGKKAKNEKCKKAKNEKGKKVKMKRDQMGLI